MARGVASGMKYLAGINFIHRVSTPNMNTKDVHRFVFITMLMNDLLLLTVSILSLTVARKFSLKSFPGPCSAEYIGG